MVDYSSDPWASYNNNYANTAARGKEQQANIDNMLNAKAAKEAGLALGKGDYKTAANALYSRGNVDAGLKVQDYGQEQDKAKRAEQVVQLTRAAQALRGLPDPQSRMTALQTQVAPTLQALGFGPEAISQIAHSDLSDQSLDTFLTMLGQEAKKLQIVATSGGGYNAVDPTTGKPVYTQAPSVFENDKTYVDYGNGQPASAASAAPAGAPAQTDPAQGGGDAYLARLGQVESNNNPNAKNGSSTGLYQFHPDTFARLGGTDINDPEQQKAAALKLAQESAQTLQQAGVPVDDANLYIMHQQGSGGGLALLTAPPEINAIAALTPMYGNPTRARQAIVNNGGTPDMTAGQFVAMWRQKWGRGAQAQAQPYQVASNGDTPPPPSGMNLPAGARVIHAAAPDPMKELQRQKLELDIAKAKQEQAPAVAPPGNPDLHGGVYLKTLPQSQAQIVKALAEGRMTFPSGMALSKPYWQNILMAVGQYDPSFDTANPQSRAKTRVDFTSGASAKNVTALNTVVGHLDGLDKAIDALPNVGGFPGAKLVNKIERGYANQAQNATAGDYADFENKKTAVANELTRVFRQSGGAEADIQDWKAKLDGADSKATLKKVVRSMAELINSRLEALGEQYKQGLGVSKDPITLLTPDKQKAFNRMMGMSGGGGQTSAPQTSGVIRYDAQGRRIK